MGKTYSDLPPPPQERLRADKPKQNWLVRGIYALARKLRSDRLIYLLFGAGDGLSNSSSLISLGLQIIDNEDAPSSERMHFWLMTPIGIALTTIEATFLMIFAMLGNYFVDKKDGSFKSFLARYWPFVRDSIKGLKGAYKAIRSVLFIAVTFASVSVVGLLLPIGLAVGGLALVSRIWNRAMCNRRRAMQDTNAYLASWNSLTVGEKEELLAKSPLLKKLISRLRSNTPTLNLTDNLTEEQLLSLVQEDKRPLQILKCYASAGLFGVMNGLYMYAGLYMVCLLAPPLALAVSIISIAFVIASLARELYDEYTYQVLLEQSAIKVKLKYSAGISDDALAQLRLRDKALNKATYKSALGEALRDGLCAYNGVTGCLFAAALFTPIPLFVLMGAIALGVVGMAAFIGYECYLTYQCKQQHLPQEKKNTRPDWLELLRSFALGVRQGPKFMMNLILNHIRKSRAAFIVSCVVSGIQSVVCTLKALAKGLGDPLKPKVPLNTSVGDLTLLREDSSSMTGRRLSESTRSPIKSTRVVFGMPPTSANNRRASAMAQSTAPGSRWGHCTS